MRRLKIENHEELVRDTRTNAILNTDNDALASYRARRDKERQLREDVEGLKTDMSEIKELLKQIVNRD